MLALVIWLCCCCLSFRSSSSSLKTFQLSFQNRLSVCVCVPGFPRCMRNPCKQPFRHLHGDFGDLVSTHHIDHHCLQYSDIANWRLSLLAIVSDISKWTPPLLTVLWHCQLNVFWSSSLLRTVLWHCRLNVFWSSSLLLTVLCRCRLNAESVSTKTLANCLILQFWG